MSTFTILGVDPETRRWGDKNDMIAYRVHLSGEQGRTVGEKGAELSRHEKAPPPRPDEIVEGELKEFPPHGWKLIKPKGAPRPSGGSGGGYGKSAEERAEIRRSVAIKAAIALLAVEAQVMGPEFFKGQKASELLVPRISFFYDDLSAAGQPS